MTSVLQCISANQGWLDLRRCGADGRTHLTTSGDHTCLTQTKKCQRHHMKSLHCALGVRVNLPRPQP